MYYKRKLPVASGVYRPLETRRYLMMSLGGHWPVMQKLPDGRLGVVTRDSDIHVRERGRLVFVTSADGGESWSHATVISAEGPDNRAPAFGVTSDGTLLVSFIKADRYIDGAWDGTKDRGGHTPMWITRSDDCGATWSEAELVDGQGHEQWSHADRTGPEDPHRYYTPFGKMLTLPDGTILMGHAITPTESPREAQASFLIRSHDSGRTWVDCVTLAEGFYCEPALCHLGGDRFLVMLRNTNGERMHTGAHGSNTLWQIDSEDGGYTWTEPRRVTGNMEHPGDAIRLEDGRLLLTYGRREPPYGIQGMVSRDDGRTWDAENRLLLVGDSGTYECGYPSSVQREDGTIVTAYYAWDSVADNFEKQHHRLGVHGAAVLYRAEDLP